MLDSAYGDHGSAAYNEGLSAMPSVGFRGSKAEAPEAEMIISKLICGTSFSFDAFALFNEV